MTKTPGPEPEPSPVRPDTANDPHDWEDAGPVTVPLRNGETADLALARVVLDELRSFQQDHPDQFGGLVALCRGQPVSPRLVSDLVADGFFVTADGTPKPLTRAVLESAVLETGDGVVLREAVDLSDERVRQAYRELDAGIARNRRRLLSPDADDTHEDGQPGPGR